MKVAWAYFSTSVNSRDSRKFRLGAGQKSVQRSWRETGLIFLISVSFCVFMCHSALASDMDLSIFVQFQTSLTHSLCRLLL